MPSLQSLPWTEPLELAASREDSHFVLLYSSARTSYSGRYSYLACNLRETVTGPDFDLLASKLSANRPWYENAWFGYLGYGLKNSLENLPADTPNWLSLPALQMMRFGTIYRFDHETQTLDYWSDQSLPPRAVPTPSAPPPEVTSISSNMTQSEYLEKAGIIIERIRDGEFYQANLTRKFTGEWSSVPDTFGLYRKLTEVSPAPYSAFIKLDDIAILSSSPELFMQIDASGHIRTRPIKGTAPRFAHPDKDRASFEKLETSVKDRAENLMIVDLMRNDLSRCSVPGSVITEGLFEVTSHTAVHHMSSTVLGQKSPGVTTLDTVAACFPPGSMTGAPKIKAMKVCSEMEGLERGVYSGAVGWFGGDGTCELSVIIRTLITKENRFEFQVGGGIVSDSIPERELFETIDKSKGILSALGIPVSRVPF